MRSKMRRMLAVMTAVIMLLAVLPMGGLVVTADTNVFPDGGFEAGTVGATPVGWNKVDGNVTVTADAAQSGSKSLLVPQTWSYATNAYINIPVEPDTAYSFTFYYSSTSATALADGWAKIVGNTTGAKLKETWMNHSNAMGGTTWRQMTMDFVSGENVSVRFELGMVDQGDGVYTSYYVDEIVCKAKPFIENGDFETGAAGGSLVKTSSNTKVTNEAAYEGNYSLKLDARSGWDTSAAINVNVVPNTDYMITLYYSYVSSSATLPVVMYFYDGTYENTTQDNLKAANGGNQLTATLNDTTAVNGTTWAKKTITFNSGANSGSIWMKFSDNGTGSSACYIDSVSCRKLVISDDGFIKNGTFESGDTSAWTIHKATSVASSEAAYSGDFGFSLIGSGYNWGGFAEQAFTTEVGKKYQVKMWLKAVEYGINVEIQNGGEKVGADWYTGTEWKSFTFEFTATATNSLIKFLGGGDNVNTVVYADDIEVIEIKDPSFDGFLYNGDFEAGTLAKWTSYQSTKLSKEAAHSGNYGVNTQSAGTSYGGLLNQTTVNVTPNVTYIVSMWLKTISGGCNIQIKEKDDNGAALAGEWFKATGWTNIVYEVTPTTNALFINFCAGNTGSPESVYIDDITVTTKMADIVSGGLTSISEDVSGLQFRFDVAATGVQDDNNEYVADSGNVKPYYGYNGDYTLVGMGAVVTNKSDVGGSVDTMVLESVDDLGKVINIPVVYLYDYTDTAVSFAVRVTDIPASKYDALIYVRAYFVFENAQGDQITVYDSEIYKQSYNGATA